MKGVKICGLTRIADIQAANTAEPDYIGFVFYSKSRRYVTPEEAAELKKQLKPQIKAVGVFVDEDPALVVRLLQEEAIDIAQLHGGEEEAYIRSVRAGTGKPVMKAVSVCSEQDILAWKDSEADYLLLDHGSGGTGESFDWALIPEISKPWFLAGGLHEGNLGSALATGAYALDISSGAEMKGKKDPEKIMKLVSRIREHR